MLERGLQGAHADLDAVVGRQALRDERREQEAALPEFLDD